MNLHPLAADISRNIDNVLVMSQVNCLPTPPDPLHNAAGGARTLLVESLENVIAKEGKRRPLICQLLISCCPQGKI